MGTNNDEYEVFCRSISNNIIIKILIDFWLIYFQKDFGKH